MKRYRICRKDLVINAVDGEWCRYEDVAEARVVGMCKSEVRKSICNGCVIYSTEAFGGHFPGDGSVDVSTAVMHEDWGDKPHDPPQVNISTMPPCDLSVTEARGLVAAIKRIIAIVEDPPVTKCSDWKNNP